MIVISFRREHEVYYGDDRESFPGSCEIKTFDSYQEVKEYIATRIKLFMAHDHYHVILDEPHRGFQQALNIDDLFESSTSVQIPGKSVITTFKPGAIFFPEWWDQSPKDELLDYLFHEITGKVREDEEREARRKEEERKKDAERRRQDELRRKELQYEQLKRELGK